MASIPSIAEALTAPRSLEDVPPALELPDGYGFNGLLFGNDLQEVLVVSCASSPTLTDGRAIHKSRDAKRNVVLVVAIEGPNGVCVVGPNPDGNLAGPLPPDQATRILQAGLDEQTALAARRRLSHLLAAVDTNDDLAGVTNSGLFANHYLSTSARERSDWAERAEASRPMLGLRGTELVTELGYQTSGLGAGALLLSSSSGPVHAVAVLMTDREGFDASTDRFGSSPVQYGLAKAHQERVPWLIVLRGSQIRLYAVRPDAGVGRRSQAETYLELDLSVVDDRTAGFLSLVFAEGALDDDGTVQELLDGSIRYATDLSERLRERVYNHVVPSLAVAAARELERLGHGDDLDAAYRITLKILFRLLFQAYAEDQGLLPYNRNDRYTRNSLTIQANDFVERPDRELDAESHDIWSDLRQVWDVIDTGNKDWGVPAYNGGLFGQDPVLHPDGHLIDQMRLDDHSTGTALRYLLTDDTGDGELGSVDFRSLSVREFGTIYEGLLESSLSRAETDLSLDKNDVYIPTDDPEKAVIRTGQIYFHNASGERKATGSYFTKPFAVEHLLERALDPTLTEHLEQVQALLTDDKPADAADKFFDFRVADLAMGSGHFLIAAIDRMEIQMAAFLTDHPIPAISQELDRLKAAARTALGDSADDHEIESSALLRRQIARRCMYGIDSNEIAVELARVAVWIHTFIPGLPMSSLDHTLVCANSLTGIGTIDEALDALEPKRKVGMPSLFAFEIEQALEEARRLLVDAANSSEATKAEVRQAAEAAAKAAEAAAPTRLLFDAAVAVRIGELPKVAGSAADIQRLASANHVQERLAVLNPAHMPFLFPEVFLREAAGFDVLIGNPPWDELHINADKFWVLYFPGHRAESDARKIELRNEYSIRRPDLASLLEQEIERADSQRRVILSGPFPIGRGVPDLYRAFSWRYLQLLRDGGMFGVVLPRAATVGSAQTPWRKALLEGGRFVEVLHIKNSKEWMFEGVHAQTTIVLVTWEKGQTQDFVPVKGTARNLSEFRELVETPVHTIAIEDLQRLSNGYAFPALPQSSTSQVAQHFYGLPTFGELSGRLKLRCGFDATASVAREATRVDRSDPDALQIIQGKHVHLWQSVVGEEFVRFDGDVALRSEPGLTFRKLTQNDNKRTFVIAPTPAGTLVKETAYWVVPEERDPVYEMFLLGYLSSRVFDWHTRTFVNRHILPSLFDTFPAIEFDRENPVHTLLSSTASSLMPSAEGLEVYDLGVPVEPSIEVGLARIDALVALILGMRPRDLSDLLLSFHFNWNAQEYSDISSQLLTELLDGSASDA